MGGGRGQQYGRGVSGGNDCIPLWPAPAVQCVNTAIDVGFSVMTNTGITGIYPYEYVVRHAYTDIRFPSAAFGRGVTEGKI